MNFYIPIPNYNRLKHMARLEDKDMTSIINHFIDKELHDIEQTPPTPQHQLPIISYMVTYSNNSQITTTMQMESVQYMSILEISQKYTGFDDKTLIATEGKLKGLYDILKQEGHKQRFKHALPGLVRKSKDQELQEAIEKSRQYRKAMDALE
jgi:hypothetical protein